MVSKPTSREIDGWVLRQRIPHAPGPHPLILMLHGWTGDEASMWVFASRLPKEAMLVSPRGLYPAPMGGYGWHVHKEGDWPWVDDFQPAIEALQQLLTPDYFPQAGLSRIWLVGFSQGAALCCAFALQHPARIRALAGLSGFLPQGAEALARNRPLVDIPVFLAHGSLDEQVPVERARQAVQVLEDAGAVVTYCEDEVGHKLSANCFRGLEEFFTQHP
jgi:phospholipase/carboxylesterase